MVASLPRKISDDVCSYWSEYKAHAAKQIVCWLNSEVFKHDLNAQVDYAISVGMAAERLKDASPEAFIAEVEVLLRNA